MVTMRGDGICEKTLVDTPLVLRWNINERTEKGKDRKNRKNGKRLVRNKLILNRRTEIITKN